MKSIAIYTFHWGTNYGGVLQSYALQEFIKNKYSTNVIIVNYAPQSFRDNIFLCFKERRLKKIIENLIDFKKEKKFKLFRKKYLNISDRFNSLKQLKKKIINIDIHIAGSDQIWNLFSAKVSEYIYFLPFDIKEGALKISYAASFGVIDKNQSYKKALDFIRQFDHISVRENEGLSFLKSNKICDISIMPDPTLLHSADFYNKISCNSNIKTGDIFMYFLQSNQKNVLEIRKIYKHKKNVIYCTNRKLSPMGIGEWIHSIKNCKCVITNSFHGSVFSILYNKPFVVLPIEGKLKNMNDRLITLLNDFELEERYVNEICPNNIKELLSKPLESEKIKTKIISLREKSSNYFNEIIDEK